MVKKQLNFTIVPPPRDLGNPFTLFTEKGRQYKLRRAKIEHPHTKNTSKQFPKPENPPIPGSQSLVVFLSQHLSHNHLSHSYYKDSRTKVLCKDQANQATTATHNHAELHSNDNIERCNPLRNPPPKQNLECVSRTKLCNAIQGNHEAIWKHGISFPERQLEIDSKDCVDMPEV